MYSVNGPFRNRMPVPTFSDAKERYNNLRKIWELSNQKIEPHAADNGINKFQLFWG